MRHVGFYSPLLTVGLLWLFSARATGQEDSHPLPENWQELPLTTFVSEVDLMMSAKDRPARDSDVWKEVSAHAGQLLVAALDSAAEADYRDLVSLYMWGNPTLTDQQRQSALKGLTPPADQVKTWTFEKVYSTHDRMRQSRMPQSLRNALVVGWLEDRDVASAITSASEQGQLVWFWGRGSVLRF